jgi:hypothetical protein
MVAVLSNGGFLGVSSDLGWPIVADNGLFAFTNPNVRSAT